MHIVEKAEVIANMGKINLGQPTQGYEIEARSVYTLCVWVTRGQ